MPRFILLVILLIPGAMPSAALSAEEIAVDVQPERLSWCQEISSPTVMGLTGLGYLGVIIAKNHEDPAKMRSSLEGDLLHTPLQVGDWYGSGWGVGLLSISSYSIGLLSHDDRMTDAGCDLAISFVAASALSGVLKHEIDRPRPNGGKFSFPSGHTTAAFSSVPVMWHHAGWKTGLGFAGLATLTGLARMEANKHYLSDVIGGATLGIVVGKLVVRRHDEGWNVGPGPGGLTVSRAF